MPRTDEQIKRNIIDSLYWDSRIDASQVKASVTNGTVELSGRVPTYAARLNAQEDTEVINGVVSVDNKLTVDYEEAMPGPADTQLQSNIENAFSWNPNLDMGSITITVKNGWVTLEGTVDTCWKKIEAEDVASNFMGVIGLTNKMAVVPTENVVDKAIAEDIIAALDRILDVEFESVNVTVEDGLVILTGSVPSLPAKRTTDNIASYTAGVSGVRNELMISGA